LIGYQGIDVNLEFRRQKKTKNAFEDEQGTRLHIKHTSRHLRIAPSLLFQRQLMVSIIAQSMEMFRRN
jgi:hypothetical protein